MRTSYIITFITCPSAEEAEKIASALMEQRVAAGCSIIKDIRSIFWWKDALETEREQLLMLRTRAELFPHVEEIVTALHSYEVPEIIAIPIFAGSGAYLHWIEHETREP